MSYKVTDIRKQMPNGGNKRSESAIKKVVLHYSGTPTGEALSFARHHTQNLGWKTSGYHQVTTLDGNVQLCYDPTVITNGAYKCNSYTYHLNYVGNGLPNAKQYATLVDLSAKAIKRFNLSVNDIVRHKDLPYNNTSCCPIDLNKFRQDVAKTLNNTSYTPQPIQSTRVLRLTSPLMYGEDVKQLQSNLNKFGYNLKIDGYYGNDTVNAVRHFQQKYNLTVDGIAGNQVFSKINELLKQQSQHKSQPTQTNKNNTKGDDDKLNLTTYQWGEIVKNIETLLKEGVITSQDWLAKAKNKELTISELAWLNNMVIMRLRK